MNKDLIKIKEKQEYKLRQLELEILKRQEEKDRKEKQVTISEKLHYEKKSKEMQEKKLKKEKFLQDKKARIEGSLTFKKKLEVTNEKVKMNTIKKSNLKKYKEPNDLLFLELEKKKEIDKIREEENKLAEIKYEKKMKEREIEKSEILKKKKF